MRKNTSISDHILLFSAQRELSQLPVYLHFLKLHQIGYAMVEISASIAFFRTPLAISQTLGLHTLTPSIGPKQVAHYKHCRHLYRLLRCV
jgi:hypothetical protein